MPGGGGGSGARNAPGDREGRQRARALPRALLVLLCTAVAYRLMGPPDEFHTAAFVGRVVVVAAVLALVALVLLPLGAARAVGAVAQRTASKRLGPGWTAHVAVQWIGLFTGIANVEVVAIRDEEAAPDAASSKPLMPPELSGVRFRVDCVVVRPRARRLELAIELVDAEVDVVLRNALPPRKAASDRPRPRTKSKKLPRLAATVARSFLRCLSVDVQRLRVNVYAHTQGFFGHRIRRDTAVDPIVSFRVDAVAGRLAQPMLRDGKGCQACSLSCRGLSLAIPANEFASCPGLTFGVIHPQTVLGVPPPPALWYDVTVEAHAELAVTVDAATFAGQVQAVLSSIPKRPGTQTIPKGMSTAKVESADRSARKLPRQLRILALPVSVAVVDSERQATARIAVALNGHVRALNKPSSENASEVEVRVVGQRSSLSLTRSGHGANGGTLAQIGMIEEVSVGVRARLSCTESAPLDVSVATDVKAPVFVASLAQLAELSLLRRRLVPPRPRRVPDDPDSRGGAAGAASAADLIDTLPFAAECRASVVGVDVTLFGSRALCSAPETSVPAGGTPQLWFSEEHESVALCTIVKQCEVTSRVTGAFSASRQGVFALSRSRNVISVMDAACYLGSVSREGFVTHASLETSPPVWSAKSWRVAFTAVASGTAESPSTLHPAPTDCFEVNFTCTGRAVSTCVSPRVFVAAGAIIGNSAAQSRGSGMNIGGGAGAGVDDGGAHEAKEGPSRVLDRPRPRPNLARVSGRIDIYDLEVLIGGEGLSHAALEEDVEAIRGLQRLRVLSSGDEASSLFAIRTARLSLRWKQTGGSAGGTPPMTVSGTVTQFHLEDGHRAAAVALVTLPSMEFQLIKSETKTDAAISCSGLRTLVPTASMLRLGDAAMRNRAWAEWVKGLRPRKRERRSARRDAASNPVVMARLKLDDAVIRVPVSGRASIEVSMPAVDVQKVNHGVHADLRGFVVNAMGVVSAEGPARILRVPSIIARTVADDDASRVLVDLGDAEVSAGGQLRLDWLLADVLALKKAVALAIKQATLARGGSLRTPSVPKRMEVEMTVNSATIRLWDTDALTFVDGLELLSISAKKLRVDLLKDPDEQMGEALIAKVDSLDHHERMQPFASMDGFLLRLAVEGFKIRTTDHAGRPFLSTEACVVSGFVCTAMAQDDGAGPRGTCAVRLCGGHDCRELAFSRALDIAGDSSSSRLAVVVEIATSPTPVKIYHAVTVLIDGVEIDYSAKRRRSLLLAAPILERVLPSSPEDVERPWDPQILAPWDKIRLLLHGTAYVELLDVTVRLMSTAAAGAVNDFQDPPVRRPSTSRARSRSRAGSASSGISASSNSSDKAWRASGMSAAGIEVKLNGMRLSTSAGLASFRATGLSFSVVHDLVTQRPAVTAPQVPRTVEEGGEASEFSGSQAQEESDALVNAKALLAAGAISKEEFDSVLLADASYRHTRDAEPDGASSPAATSSRRPSRSTTILEEDVSLPFIFLPDFHLDVTLNWTCEAANHHNVDTTDAASVKRFAASSLAVEVDIDFSAADENADLRQGQYEHAKSPAWQLLSVNEPLVLRTTLIDRVRSTGSLEDYFAATYETGPLAESQTDEYEGPSFGSETPRPTLNFCWAAMPRVIRILSALSQYPAPSVQPTSTTPPISAILKPPQVRLTVRDLDVCWWESRRAEAGLFLRIGLIVLDVQSSVNFHLAVSRLRGYDTQVARVPAPVGMGAFASRVTPVSLFDGPTEHRHPFVLPNRSHYFIGAAVLEMARGGLARSVEQVFGVRDDDAREAAERSPVLAVRGMRMLWTVGVLTILQDCGGAIMQVVDRIGPLTSKLYAVPLSEMEETHDDDETEATANNRGGVMHASSGPLLIHRRSSSVRRRSNTSQSDLLPRLVARAEAAGSGAPPGGSWRLRSSSGTFESTAETPHAADSSGDLTPATVRVLDDDASDVSSTTGVLQRRPHALRRKHLPARLGLEESGLTVNPRPPMSDAPTVVAATTEGQSTTSSLRAPLEDDPSKASVDDPWDVVSPISRAETPTDAEGAAGELPIGGSRVDEAGAPPIDRRDSMASATRESSSAASTRGSIRSIDKTVIRDLNLGDGNISAIPTVTILRVRFFSPQIAVRCDETLSTVVLAPRAARLLVRRNAAMSSITNADVVDVNAEGSSVGPSPAVPVRDPESVSVGVETPMHTVLSGAGENTRVLQRDVQVRLVGVDAFVAPADVDVAAGVPWATKESTGSTFSGEFDDHYASDDENTEEPQVVSATVAAAAEAFTLGASHSPSASMGAVSSDDDDHDGHAETKAGRDEVPPPPENLVIDTSAPALSTKSARLLRRFGVPRALASAYASISGAGRGRPSVTTPGSRGSHGSVSGVAGTPRTETPPEWEGLGGGQRLLLRQVLRDAELQCISALFVQVTSDLLASATPTPRSSSVSGLGPLGGGASAAAKDESFCKELDSLSVSLPSVKVTMDPDQFGQVLDVIKRVLLHPIRHVVRPDLPSLADPSTVTNGIRYWSFGPQNREQEIPGLSPAPRTPEAEPDVLLWVPGHPPVDSRDDIEAGNEAGAGNVAVSDTKGSSAAKVKSKRRIRRLTAKAIVKADVETALQQTQDEIKQAAAARRRRRAAARRPMFGVDAIALREEEREESSSSDDNDGSDSGDGEGGLGKTRVNVDRERVIDYHVGNVEWTLHEVGQFSHGYAAFLLRGLNGRHRFSPDGASDVQTELKWLQLKNLIDERRAELSKTGEPTSGDSADKTSGSDGEKEVPIWASALGTAFEEGRKLGSMDCMLVVRAKTRAPIEQRRLAHVKKKAALYRHVVDRIDVYEHLEVSIFPGVVHSLVAQVSKSWVGMLTQYFWGSEPTDSSAASSGDAEAMLLASKDGSLLTRARATMEGVVRRARSYTGDSSDSNDSDEDMRTTTTGLSMSSRQTPFSVATRPVALSVASRPAARSVASVRHTRSTTYDSQASARTLPSSVGDGSDDGADEDQPTVAVGAPVEYKYFRYVRIGALMLTISCRGFGVALNGVEIKVKPKVIHRKLWTWPRFFQRVKSSIVREILRAAPGMMKQSIRGRGHFRSSSDGSTGTLGRPNLVPLTPREEKVEVPRRLAARLATEMSMEFGFSAGGLVSYADLRRRSRRPSGSRRRSRRSSRGARVDVGDAVSDTEADLERNSRRRRRQSDTVDGAGAAAVLAEAGLPQSGADAPGQRNVRSRTTRHYRRRSGGDISLLASRAVVLSESTASELASAVLGGAGGDAEIMDSGVDSPDKAIPSRTRTLVKSMVGRFRRRRKKRLSEGADAADSGSPLPPPAPNPRPTPPTEDHKRKLMFGGRN